MAYASQTLAKKYSDSSVHVPKDGTFKFTRGVVLILSLAFRLNPC